VKVIFYGTVTPFDSLEAGAVFAATTVRMRTPSTVRMRVRADLVKELAAMLDDKLFNPR